MGRIFTIEDLKKSKVASINQHLLEQPSKQANKQRLPRKNSKHVCYIKEQLTYWCMEKGYKLQEEFRFHPARKYRFDFCIKELMIAVEYQGGIFMEKSGHSNCHGATRDADKANLAQSEGWKVLTFTALNYKNIITELKKNIK
jgi:very-short-patch-repair endonuclease